MMLTPIPTNPHGTPNRALHAMTDDQLVARYQQIRRAQAAANYLPNRLRAAPTPDARKSSARLQNELNRIRRIAAARALVLPEAQLSAAIRAENATTRDPRDVETGDRVHVEYRNPGTDEILSSDGDVIRLEWSQNVGGIYHVRLDNGRVVLVSKRNLKRIS